MSSGGETEQNPSGLTVDTLRILLMREIDAVRGTINENDRRYQERYEAQRDAIEEKDRTTQARLSILNEHKQQTNDLTARMPTRFEVDQRFEALDNKIDQRAGAIESKVNESIRARSDAVAQINSRLDLQAGSSAGTDKTRQLIAWGIAVLLGLVSIGTIMFATTGR